MSLLSYEPLEVVHENMKKGSIYSVYWWYARIQHIEYRFTKRAHLPLRKNPFFSNREIMSPTCSDQRKIIKKHRARKLNSLLESGSWNHELSSSNTAEQAYKKATVLVVRNILLASVLSLRQKAARKETKNFTAYQASLHAIRLDHDEGELVRHCRCRDHDQEATRRAHEMEQRRDIAAAAARYL